MTITLEQQIEEAVRLSNCNDEPSIEYLDSILASLRRLQAIDQQESVGAVEKNSIAMLAAAGVPS